MNQILFTETKKRNNTQDTRKIVLFFAITIIIFGLILSGQGAYGLYNKLKDKKEEKTTPNEETNIQLQQLENGEIQIKVESKIGISELIYSWNNDSAQTISESGKMVIKETIEAKPGENDLTVKTIDLNGKQTTKHERFISNISKPSGPQIDLSVVGDKMKIIVNSTENISYVTYKWNSEEEQKVDMVTYEDKTKFEKEIQIPRGSNTLIVTAVDVKNNSSEKSQDIKGVTKPKSSPVIQGEYIYFEVTSYEDIKQVEFTFNDVPYIIKEDTIKASGQTQKLTYRLKLKKGMNYLVIKTTTVSGIVGEDVWKYEYKK